MTTTMLQTRINIEDALLGQPFLVLDSPPNFQPTPLIRSLQHQASLINREHESAPSSSPASYTVHVQESSTIDQEQQKADVQILFKIDHTTLLLPNVSKHGLESRFIDVNSPLLVYIALKFDKRGHNICENDIGVTSFQPSRLHGDAVKRAPPLNNRDSSLTTIDSYLRLAAELTPDENDFGLHMLLRCEIQRFFAQFVTWEVMSQECVSGRRNILRDLMSQSIQGTIRNANSKCIVTGRAVPARYRTGFKNEMQHFELAKSSGFGYSLIRHYLKYEMAVIRYMYTNVSSSSSWLSPIPCFIPKEEMSNRNICRECIDLIAALPSIQDLETRLKEDKIRMGCEGLDLVMWMLLCNRLYLVPTAIPNSNHLFPKDAKLYAMLSVDKKFEEDYEDLKEKRNKTEDSFVDKFAALYPTEAIDLFSTLAPVRTNPSMTMMTTYIQQGKPPKDPKHAIIVQYIGVKETDTHTRKYGEYVRSEKVVLPRLLVDYGEQHKTVPTLVAHKSSALVAWMKQFRQLY